MMEKKCLLVIDYQNDFVSDNGLLTAGKAAQAIETAIVKSVDSHIAENAEVFFTLDTHCKQSYAGHPESAQFKLHCEKNTVGWELYGALNKYMHERPTMVSLVEKKAYCLDFDFLNRLTAEYSLITLMGVVTDICVLQTAVGLYTAKVNNDSDVKIMVEEGGCASFNLQGHSYALNYMKNTLGFEII